MRKFVELASEWQLQRAFACRMGTLHQFKTPERLQSTLNWGMSNAFHFDKDVSAAKWVSLRESVKRVLRADAALRDLVRFVPYAEVGLDFVVQAKPPYDAGYFLCSMNEWLAYGDAFRPSVACELANSRLQAAIQRVLESLSATGETLLEHVIRVSFTEDPACQLQFIEEEGWTLYELQVADEHLHLLEEKRS